MDLTMATVAFLSSLSSSFSCCSGVVDLTIATATAKQSVQAERETSL